MANTVKQLKTVEEYNEILTPTDPNKLVVIDFTAKWCGPCQVIAPFYADLAEKYPHVQFTKLDTDEVAAASKIAGVRSMPTFHFMKGNVKVDQLIGAFPKKLEELVKQHSGNKESAIPSQFPPGHDDLTDYVEANQLDALNQKKGHDVRNILNEDASYLESDVDEQLIIGVPFNQTVKLHSLKLVAASKAHAPKSIKLYVNRPTLGFDEVDSVEPTQTLDLTEEDYADDKLIPLRFVKWQSVSSVVIFIGSNLGEEETTQLRQLIFVGQTVETTKMDDLKKIGADGQAAPGPSK
jgi:thioredoxin